MEVADYPAMSFFFVCWHSRRWWPPIRGGTLQLALLRLEKVNWTDYFCIKSFLCTNCQWKGKKQHKKQAKALQKPVFSCLSQNSWNEGSLKMEISKTRESIHFCSFLQEISSFYKCFSVLNWDSQFQNFIEEFQCLQCMSNIGLLITFHTATSGAICWLYSHAIPRFGNFYFEGSLVLEISILRDPSF